MAVRHGLSWSRALYVEFVARANTATFIRCHLHGFEYFGGVVQHCLYDRTKLVALGLDEAGEVRWNEQFLDFALRLGFEIRLCQGYRPQTNAAWRPGPEGCEAGALRALPMVSSGSSRTT